MAGSAASLPGSPFTAPMHKGPVPLLAVEDLARTMTFYEQTLGFRCVASFGKPKPVWCMLNSGVMDLMFNQPPPESVGGHGATARKVREGQAFYFYPDDAVALHAKCRRRGAAVGDLRVTVYGMKEFGIEDPDGYH